MMHRVFLSLGSNLGEREQLLAKAIALIDLRIGEVKQRSALYETEPWGFETNNKFLNMVVMLETALAPEVVLDRCLNIEQALGRKRTENTGYTSRTIDVDVLFYDRLVLSTPDLVLPHPHIQNRRFILAPLCEVAPEFLHPLLGQSISSLLAQCDDKGQVIQAGFLKMLR